MNQPIYYDHGINIEDAAKIRKEISVPVTVVGSVTLEQAEQYIAEGKADMVSMARGLMADPMVVKNAKSGCLRIQDHASDAIIVLTGRIMILLR
mgnify:CR=1 FL=1